MWVGSGRLDLKKKIAGRLAKPVQNSQQSEINFDAEGDKVHGAEETRIFDRRRRRPLPMIGLQLSPEHQHGFQLMERKTHTYLSCQSGVSPKLFVLFPKDRSDRATATGL